MLNTNQDTNSSENDVNVIDIKPASNSNPEYIDIEGSVGELNISKAQEDTRAKIATLFTQYFLTIITFCLIIPYIFNALNQKAFKNPIEDAKGLVTVLSSVLSGPFGFIVGFYFKQNTKS